MKNLQYSYFITTGSICEDTVQYAFLNKDFNPTACGVRMINNISNNTETFVQRISNMLDDIKNDVGPIRRFIYDKDFGDGSYVLVFKVRDYGYILLVCDTESYLNVILNEKRKLFIEDIREVVDKYNEMVVCGKHGNL